MRDTPDLSRYGITGTMTAREVSEIIHDLFEIRDATVWATPSLEVIEEIIRGRERRAPTSAAPGERTPGTYCAVWTSGTRTGRLPVSTAHEPPTPEDLYTLEGKIAQLNGLTHCVIINMIPVANSIPQE